MTQFEISLWLLQFSFTVVSIFTSANIILYFYIGKSKLNSKLDFNVSLAFTSYLGITGLTIFLLWGEVLSCFLILGIYLICFM